MIQLIKSIWFNKILFFNNKNKILLKIKKKINKKSRHKRKRYKKILKSIQKTVLQKLPKVEEESKRKELTKTGKIKTMRN